MNPKRARILRAGPFTEGPVAYWMSRDQRSRDNWALLHAQQAALELKTALIVLFSQVSDYLGAQPSHFNFMLSGLREVARELQEKNIPFFLLSGDPGTIIPAFLSETKAGLLVTDFDPLRIKRYWKQQVLEKTTLTVVEVDAHNVIPCWEASDHQEFGAYTLRPKIHRQLATYLDVFPILKRHPFDVPPTMNVAESTAQRGLPPLSATPVLMPPSGHSAAARKLNDFVASGLPDYDKRRNDPSLDGQSGLSPYLHFGQIAAQRIILAVSGSGLPQALQDPFLEELVVRRELADNFCYYNENYDNTKGFPAWAQKTLEKHRFDARPFVYDRDVLESGSTHDPAWNAAQRQMTSTGKMHGYMRMYWAKKLLEWTADPVTAVQTAIYLNDRYSLDGRDPNGYAGIAWSIGGVHDRAWGERPVFGSIRYMNAAGLRRKFDIQSYIARFANTTTDV